MTNYTTLATTLLITLTISSFAQAFEIKRTSVGTSVHWNNPVVEYVVDPTASNMNADDVLNAVSNAFYAWDDVASSALSLQFAGIQEGAREGYDSNGPNTNVVRIEEELFQFDSSVLAITLMTYSVTSGNLLDADIVANGVDFAFSNDISAHTFDLENALAHEVGHFVGLSHELSHEEATMFPTAVPQESSKRSLSTDDMMGISYIYPAQPETSDLNDFVEEGTTAASIQNSDNAFDQSISLERVEIGLSCSQRNIAGTSPLSMALALLGLVFIARRKSTNR
jgi:hypothetical protein